MVGEVIHWVKTVQVSRRTAPWNKRVRASVHYTIIPTLAFCVPIIIIINIIIIIIIIISFMQGIYTYIPETNYVPREYSVAAILLLLFMVLISLVESIVLLHQYFPQYVCVFFVQLYPCFLAYVEV